MFLTVVSTKNFNFFYPENRLMRVSAFSNSLWYLLKKSFTKFFYPSPSKAISVLESLKRMEQCLPASEIPSLTCTFWLSLSESGSYLFMLKASTQYESSSCSPTSINYYMIGYSSSLTYEIQVSVRHSSMSHYLSWESRLMTVSLRLQYRGIFCGFGW